MTKYVSTDPFMIETFFFLLRFLDVVQKSENYVCLSFASILRNSFKELQAIQSILYI